jgi:hypothetical protein
MRLIGSTTDRSRCDAPPFPAAWTVEDRNDACFIVKAHGSPWAAPTFPNLEGIRMPNVKLIPNSNSGSLAILAAMRGASSQVALLWSGAHNPHLIRKPSRLQIRRKSFGQLDSKRTSSTVFASSGTPASSSISRSTGKSMSTSRTCSMFLSRPQC